MLSKRQFASAVGATEKWVDNAGRILGRRLSRTPSEARWLGLVREISQTFESTLVRAGELATRTIQLDPHSPPTPIAEAAMARCVSSSTSSGIMLDLVSRSLPHSSMNAITAGRRRGAPSVWPPRPPQSSLEQRRAARV